MAKSGGTIEISNCFNIGKITKTGDAFKNIGGILGQNIANTNINNCYNIATFVQGHSTNSIGGIVGKNTGTVTLNKCYYLKSEYIAKAVAGVADETGQVTACNEISEITADILNDNINNIEHSDEWKKWKIAEEEYPIFE